MKIMNPALEGQYVLIVRLMGGYLGFRTPAERVFRVDAVEDHAVVGYFVCGVRQGEGGHRFTSDQIERVAEPSEVEQARLELAEGTHLNRCHACNDKVEVEGAYYCNFDAARYAPKPKSRHA